MVSLEKANFIATIKSAARLLNGHKRRRFEAEVTRDYFEGNVYRAERALGWSRKTTTLGFHELASGIICLDMHSNSGRKKVEEKLLSLEEDIRSIVEPESQTDPKFQSRFRYTKVTSEAVINALIEDKGYDRNTLPCEKTIYNLLERMDYRMRRVQKTKPKKKIDETDDIFGNVKKNEKSDKDESSLRISIDVKEKVKIGEFSRGGKTRSLKASKALDHDFATDGKLVPVGILVVLTGMLHLAFGTSKETSDLIVDTLISWWEKTRETYSKVKELVINLDNGPSVSGNRTQFLKRMVQFSQSTGLVIRLVYYPPYHSKYNPIEHCWGVLEHHWSCAILKGIKDVISWASTMTWRGEKPSVELIEKEYKTGISLSKREMIPYQAHIERSELLPAWDLLINPHLQI